MFRNIQEEEEYERQSTLLCTFPNQHWVTVFSFSCRNRPSIASLGIIVREEGLLSVANNHGPPAANIVDAVFQETITIPRRPASRKLPVLPVPLRSIVSVTTRPCSTVFTRGRVGRGRSERTYLVAHPQAPDSAISRICKNTRRARVCMLKLSKFL